MTLHDVPNGPPTTAVPPAHLLVVDDEPMVREVVTRYLEQDGHTVTVVPDGAAALQAVSGAEFDLVVLDLMLPHVDGLSVLAELRRERATPVIVLTARGEEEDRIRGLQLGADDYVVKPFSTRELISRVRAVLRRAQPEPDLDENGPLKLGDLVLDVEAHRVLAGDKPLRMGPTEFRILRAFMAHPGRAWSRRQLLGEVWGGEHSVEERTVDVHIRRLRKALQVTGHDRYVQTVRGHGYRFSDVV